MAIKRRSDVFESHINLGDIESGRCKKLGGQKTEHNECLIIVKEDATGRKELKDISEYIPTPNRRILED